MKRVAFCTFGCRLNQYDTETLRTLIERESKWTAVSSDEDAEVYVVNTCTVTAQADASARKMIRRLHGRHPDARIVVTGCYAQRAPAEIAALPGVAIVVGTADRGSIAARLDATVPGQVQLAVSPIEDAKTFLEVPIDGMKGRTRAWVKVQEGCNESCTFCIIPQTRGRSRSREPHHVLDQVRLLVDAGYREIVVSGVHVGDYGVDLPQGRHMLPDLLHEILQVSGVERLRLSSIEPASVTDLLIDLVATESRFARHLHIPFQSGSDAVLERMGRRYTSGQFCELVGRISERVAGCGIGTDVICGFPGESEDDFRRTFDCLERLPITYVHAFTYSVRPGSAAERHGDQVPPDTKRRRIRALKRLSTEKNRMFREAHRSGIVTVLYERGPEGERGVSHGWTDNYLRVEVEDGGGEGEIGRVRVVDLSPEGLRGVSVREPTSK